VSRARAVPTIGRAEAAGLARVEYRRLVDLLRGLDDEQWTAPTDCPEWSVRDVVAHVLGALEASASVREQLHQMWGAWRSARTFVDGLGVVQIRDRAHVPPRQLVDRLDAVAERGIRERQRVPAALRAIPIRFTVPYGVEHLPLGRLLDTILLRDAWMHRVDVARATGATLVLTPEHDGRIVADVVGEWSRRHGQPFRLELDGPAGGRFVEEGAGEELGLDAVEFCRIVSGRAQGAGLLTQEVPF
jgi:uncharacterized protein (TIGR03083 family)